MGYEYDATCMNLVGRDMTRDVHLLQLSQLVGCIVLITTKLLHQLSHLNSNLAVVGIHINVYCSNNVIYILICLYTF
jgi:hypothetical protein